MRHSENNKCLKCGGAIPTKLIEYEYVHDMGLYPGNYYEVDREFGVEVNCGFYHKSCFNKVGQGNGNEIIERGKEFLENDLSQAIKNITHVYETKLAELMQIKEVVETSINSLQRVDRLDELSIDELDKLRVTCNTYQPIYNEIKVGFPGFNQISEIDILYQGKISQKEG